MVTTPKADKTDVYVRPNYFETMDILRKDGPEGKVEVVKGLAMLTGILDGQKAALTEALKVLPEFAAFTAAKDALDKASAELPAKVEVDWLTNTVETYIRNAKQGRSDCEDLAVAVKPVGRPKGSTNKPK
jgi:hypothetical protein